MAKFVISDTLPCWVTFRRVIEADSLEDAQQAWMDGEQGTELDTIIGDSIDYIGQGDTDLEPYAEPEAA